MEKNIKELVVKESYVIYDGDSPMELGTYELLKVTDTALLFDKNFFILVSDINEYKIYRKV